MSRREDPYGISTTNRRKTAYIGNRSLLSPAHPWGKSLHGEKRHAEFAFLLRRYDRQNSARWRRRFTNGFPTAPIQRDGQHRDGQANFGKTAGLEMDHEKFFRGLRSENYFPPFEMSLTTGSGSSGATSFFSDVSGSSMGVGDSMMGSAARNGATSRCSAFIMSAVR